MESGLWVQQRLDDTPTLTYIPAHTGYAYAPWMRSVPAPWMMHSISERWMVPSVPTPLMHSAPRRYDSVSELPSRLRSRIRSTVAAMNDRAPELQNPQYPRSRTVCYLSNEDCMSNSLIKCLGRLTTSEENTICTICQEKIDVKEKIAILRCDHGYHARCIEKWLMIKNECAVCRARPIPDENI